ncbi:MAG: hypothetical protein ACTMII_00235, partial [Brachybacterium sp.]
YTSTSTRTGGGACCGTGSTRTRWAADFGSLSCRRRRAVLGARPGCGRTQACNACEAAIGQHLSVRPRPSILHRGTFRSGDHGTRTEW